MLILPSPHPTQQVSVSPKEKTEVMDVDEMKGRVRAANQTGVRLDGGGDDRPPVYMEGDKVVYRASGVGGLCVRALWLARTGVDPSPTPAALATAYRESANNEDVAIAMFTANQYFKVDRQQEEFEIPVSGTDAVIRGHVDGVGHDSVMGREGVVEVKCIADDTWRGRKLDMYPGWEPQVQLEMKGLGLKIAWVVFGRKVDGVVEETSYAVEEYQPRVIGQVFDKVRMVEEAVKAGESIACPEERWGCPYWQLHEGDPGDGVQEVEDQGAAVLAQSIARLSKHIKTAETEMKAGRGEMLEWLEGLKAGKGVIVTGRGTGKFRVTMVEPTRTKVDVDQMRKDGVDVDKYTVISAGNKYVKITEEEG